MTKKYDLAIFIGRFQPFHWGHAQVIHEALEQANKVAVIIGSCGAPRTHRNPFSFEERRTMIRGSFMKNVVFAGIEDIVYNDEAWIKQVQAAVLQVYEEAYGAYHPLAKIALIGHNKDNTSFYLNLFPQWDSIALKEYKAIAATDIRNSYFKYWDPKSGNVLKFKEDYVEAGNVIPLSTEKFLNSFRDTQAYDMIKDEYLFVDRYKRSWQDAPFPPIFVTVDAVVVQAGHVLLVQRGAKPGKGLLALPGGFLEQDEWIEDGVFRELQEETRIKVPLPALKGSVVAREVFDGPHRSARGRTITHAYLVHLKPTGALPKVRGADDATHAGWYPISEVKRSMMFEDHYDILLNLTQRL